MKKFLNNIRKETKRTKWYKLLSINNKIYPFFFLKSKKKYLFLREQNFNLRLYKFGFLKKKFLTNEIIEMMYGFGDSDKPLKNSVFEIEKIVISFVTKIMLKISHISFCKLGKRPWAEDLLFLLRNCSRKIHKVVYLLKMKYVIEDIMNANKPTRIFGKKMVEKM
mmetsp:Transcript_66602/g.158865  ORF Transcript_66602/g.158865 Transcript_66602/m.158865 type:complete len:165 (+) Transcript_66602:43-537(+)